MGAGSTGSIDDLFEKADALLLLLLLNLVTFLELCQLKSRQRDQRAPRLHAVDRDAIAILVGDHDVFWRLTQRVLPRAAGSRCTLPSRSVEQLRHQLRLV